MITLLACERKSKCPDCAIVVLVNTTFSVQLQTHKYTFYIVTIIEHMVLIVICTIYTAVHYAMANYMFVCLYIAYKFTVQ